MARGWIKTAAGPADLAGQIGVDPAVLAGTLDEYNAAARAGRDDRFGRSADTLVPLDLSRLYAIETWPGIAGTTGGPQHDERAQVLRPDGQPVPGLYAAGAVSLVWGHLIEHGGGLTDALVFGRLAGANAAARAARPQAACRVPPVSRVAVVTGGAGAIGGSIVTALHAAGHIVVSLDQAGDPAVDLADEQQVRAAAAAVLDARGQCDVLVHAAAAFDRADLAGLDLASWRRVQAVNVESALLLAQAFAPGMAARGFGRIIFVVSDTIWSPPAGDMLPYVTSKGALVALARTLAVGLGRDGIAVSCVAPGLTDTPAARAGQPAAAFDGVRSRQALPRTLVPQDVAATVAFLATDAAAALTGQTLCVDGGLILR